MSLTTSFIHIFKTPFNFRHQILENWISAVGRLWFSHVCFQNSEACHTKKGSISLVCDLWRKDATDLTSQNYLNWLKEFLALHSMNFSTYSRTLEPEVTAGNCQRTTVIATPVFSFSLSVWLTVGTVCHGKCYYQSIPN